MHAVLIVLTIKLLYQCFVPISTEQFNRMNISSISQSNILGEDVLQMIFQHSDAEDLLNCEAVCRQWRDILLAGTPWRRLYHRNIVRLPLWRKAHKILKNQANQLTWRTDQYRDYCKDILQADRNWRRGKFTKFTYPEKGSRFEAITFISISDDYVAWDIDCDDETSHCAFLDTESMEIKEIVASGCLQNLNEMAIIWPDFTKIEIVNPKNRWVVNALDGLAEGFDALDWISMGFESSKAEFGSKLLVTSNSEPSLNNPYYYMERMRIWKMGNPPVLLQDRTLLVDLMRVVKVDDRFIVRYEENNNRFTLCFISTETLEEFGAWSLKSYDCKWHYDRGLLFQFNFERKDNLIRILDVTTGFFNDVRLPVRNETMRSVEFMDPWASSNSRLIVIGWRYSTTVGKFSNFSFYDLEDAKKPSSDCRCYPLYTLQFQFNVWRFVMDESLIAFYGHGDNGEFVKVLNFTNFGPVERKTSDLQEKQETDEAVEIKIIFDPFVDSLPLDNC